jgi:hypothetical protein
LKYKEEIGSHTWDKRNRLSENRIMAITFLLDRSLYIKCGLRLKAERFTQSTVQVAAPNGGEAWTAGTTHDIAWHLNNATGNVIIELYKGDVWNQAITTVDSAAKKYEWTIQGGTTVGADYRIHLRMSNSVNLEDSSDNLFAIAASGSSYTLLNERPSVSEQSLDPSIRFSGENLQISGTRVDHLWNKYTPNPSLDEESDQNLKGPHAGTPATTTPISARATLYGTTYYIHSFDGKLLAEYDSTGVCVKDYIYMGNKLLAEYQPVTATKYYYASDQINSTRIITDSAGTVVYSALFDPYGGMQKQ